MTTMANHRAGMKVRQRIGWRASGVLLVACVSASATAGAPSGTLRVCADPDNLPFSNAQLQGFENRIVDLIAADLHTQVSYTWSPLRRGFLRRTLHAGTCDVVMGLAEAAPGVLLTKPYYTTSYAFVYGANANIALDDFDVAGMRQARIALHAVNVEGFNPAPVSSLIARGLQDRVVGFLPWGRTGEDCPQCKIIDAVVNGEVDVAVVWGPVAGYFASRHPGKLTVKAIVSDPKVPEISFKHSIAIGVRAEDAALREAIQLAMSRNQQAILSILSEYSVPLIDEQPGAARLLDSGPVASKQ